MQLVELEHLANGQQRRDRSDQRNRRRRGFGVRDAHVVVGRARSPATGLQGVPKRRILVLPSVVLKHVIGEVGVGKYSLHIVELLQAVEEA